MSVIDLNSILTPVVPEDPCGIDVEYDPAFAALDRAAQGKPEQQIGSTVVPASEPDWKLVQKQSLELLSRTKDLRVGALLTRPASQQRLAGLRRGAGGAARFRRTLLGRGSPAAGSDR